MGSSHPGIVPERMNLGIDMRSRISKFLQAAGSRYAALPLIWQRVRI
jgi:hypothetical protein